MSPFRRRIGPDRSIVPVDVYGDNGPASGAFTETEGGAVHHGPDGHSSVDAIPESHDIIQSIGTDGRTLRETEPVYHGQVKLLSWTSNDRGMSLKLQLLNVNGEARHPFQFLRWSSTIGEGQRLLVNLSRIDDSSSEVSEMLWLGETTLGWWADDCCNGMHITLRIDDRSDEVKVPLHGLNTGKKTGDIVFLACWIIGDDELPEPPPRSSQNRRTKTGDPKTVVRKKFSELDATRQAAIKCGDAEFQNWCFQHVKDILTTEDMSLLPPAESSSAAYAVMVVRLYCGINSRSELGLPDEAGDRARLRWQGLLKKFEDWRFQERYRDIAH